MRLGAADAQMLSLTSSRPGSLEALAALGRMVSETSEPVRPGTPLAVWCSGMGELDATWLEEAPQSGRLWRELADLRLLCGSMQPPDLTPYNELQQLRLHFDATVTS